ncbi:hypothetical protein C7N83_07620 [Neisseria iguanae]|uniref:Uncharacterized protein n=1 Tax=Neisseria iguanae TaxID=90242 RepID=A0A2P7TZP3_9NEIS|nr:hypothetical protein C7N83_07620 [Neisseria iguanae]
MNPYTLLMAFFFVLVCVVALSVYYGLIHQPPLSRNQIKFVLFFLLATLLSLIGIFLSLSFFPLFWIK